MGKVMLTVTGDEKENVSAVTIGSGRWGDNGVKWSESQTIADGTQPVKVYKTTGDLTGSTHVLGETNVQIVVYASSLTIVP